MRSVRGHMKERPEGSGQWALVIDLGRDPVTRRRRQKWHTFHGSERAAGRELTRLLAERDQGLAVPSANTSTGEYLSSWLKTYAEGATAPTTYRRYQGLIRTHITPAIGDIPLQRLEPLHVQSIYTKMLDKKLAARTVTQAHRIVRQALQHALKWGLVTRNVADSVTLPKPERFKPMTLEPEQLRHVLAVADETAYGSFFFLLASTGLRQSELCGLTWEAVSLDRRELTVEQSLHWLPRKGFLVREPKTTQSVRVVTLSDDTVQRLREHRRERLQAKLSAGPAYQEGNWVFADALGRPLHPSNIRTAWKKITSEADVEGLRVHDLRHCHASTLLRQGVSLKAISARLGHSSIATTGNLYAHLTGDMEQEAANAFDRALASG